VAAIGLGSNLGERDRTIAAGLAALDRLPRTRLDRVSRLLETEPVGPPGQGPYLNGAALLRTHLPPRRLLEALLEIERRHGRDRAREIRHGPRTLDLDLLIYGDLVVEEDGLSIPHPRMSSRRFVLEPLAEIAGGLLHPTLGASVDSLLERLTRRNPAAEGSSSRSADPEPARGASNAGVAGTLSTFPTTPE